MIPNFVRPHLSSFFSEATRIPEKRVKSTTTYLPLVPRGRRSLEGLILEKLIEKRAPLEKVQYETDCCSFETSDVEKLKSPENWKNYRNRRYHLELPLLLLLTPLPSLLKSLLSLFAIASPFVRRHFATGKILSRF